MTQISNHENNVFRSAFTLVELLVVMSIIAVLLGVLLPALAKSREEANAAICTTQLDQIFKATYMYASDHDERLPFFGYVSGRETREWWPTQIFEALSRKAEIYVCPSDPEPHQMAQVVRLKSGKLTMSLGSEPGRFPLDITYRGSCDSIVNGLGRRITDWYDPGHAIILIEAQAQEFESQGGRECYRFMTELITVGTQKWYDRSNKKLVQTWKRHSGTSNYLFLDGAIKRLHPSEVPALARRQEYEGESTQRKAESPTRNPG